MFLLRFRIVVQCSFVKDENPDSREKRDTFQASIRSGTLNYSPAPTLTQRPTDRSSLPIINLPSQAPLNDKVGLEPPTVALVFVNKRFQNLLIILWDCDLAVFNKMLYSNQCVVK